MTVGRDVERASHSGGYRGSPHPSANRARGHCAHADGSQQATGSSAGIDARSAHSSYARWRARQIAYGRWQPWADAAPVRDHVSALRRHGASYRAIAEAAGVSPMTVHHLLNGRSSQTGQLPSRVGSAQASRLLALSLPAVPGGRRDSCGARRRLQGLVALGHCPTRLARQAGITSPRMRRLLAGQTRRVSPALHAAIADLYDQMWNRLPPEQTRREQAIADAARHRAQAAGWSPPMALDDDRIDDPAYQPRIAWRRAAGLPPAPQPPVPRLCTAGSAEPGFPQGHTAGMTRGQGRLPGFRHRPWTERGLTYELRRTCPDEG